MDHYCLYLSAFNISFISNCASKTIYMIYLCFFIYNIFYAVHHVNMYLYYYFLNHNLQAWKHLPGQVDWQNKYPY